jgi:UDP-GlcNAc:undecaprenyl-phosphate GlcNAc-1-phosphate transferase
MPARPREASVCRYAAHAHLLPQRARKSRSGIRCAGARAYSVTEHQATGPAAEPCVRARTFTPARATETPPRPPFRRPTWGFGAPCFVLEPDPFGMRTYLAAFVVACIVAAVVTPLVRRLALRVGAVSLPGGRHVHGAAIPRLGGIAILIAFLVPIASLFFVDSSVATIALAHPWHAGGLLLGATVIAIVGVVDDTRGVRALYKLFAQVAVAALAFACGFRIEAITLPVLGTVSMGAFAFPVTILWITGVVNAVNLIDGLDGLAAGVVLFAGITNFVVANIANSAFVAVVMAAMLGAVLGFLIFNFNPARIFMGDSGSYPLGYILATTALFGASSQKTSTAVALAVPCLALGVPIFDTLFSMTRRFLERRPIFSPDRGHIHHRLLDMGLTQRRAVLVLYAVSALLSVAAIATSLGNDWQVGVALLVSSVAFLALVRFAGYFQYVKQRLTDRGLRLSPDAERLRREFPALVERLALADGEGSVVEAVAAHASSAGFRFSFLDHSTEPPPSSGSRRAEPRSLTATFPIGTSAHASFSWLAENGSATPETQVLLQLVVDLVERALERCGREIIAPASRRAAPPGPSMRQPRTVPSTIASRP